MSVPSRLLISRMRSSLPFVLLGLLAIALLAFVFATRSAAPDTLSSAGRSELPEAGGSSSSISTSDNKQASRLTSDSRSEMSPASHGALVVLGQVRTQNGPAPDVEILLREGRPASEPEGSTLAVAHSDEAGRFQFEVRATQLYSLTCKLAGYQELRVSALPGDPLDLLLSPARFDATFTLKLVDETGNDLEGIMIVEQLEGDAPTVIRPEAEIKSGASFAARLTKDRARLRFSLEAACFRPTTLVLDEVRGNSFVDLGTIKLESLFPVIRGVVVDADTHSPISGVRVDGCSESNHWHAHATSDASGLFALVRRAGQSIASVAFSDQLGRGKWAPLWVVPPPEVCRGQEELRVELNAGASIVGSVHDALGKESSDFQVEAWCLRPDGELWSHWYARTDKHTVQYSIEHLPAGRVWVGIRKEKRPGESADDDPELKQCRDIRSLQLEVGARETVEFVVGNRSRVHGRLTAGKSRRIDWRDVELSLFDESGNIVAKTRPNSEAGEDGKYLYSEFSEFQFLDVTVGRYELRVGREHPFYRTTKPAPVVEPRISVTALNCEVATIDVSRLADDS